MLRSIVLDNVLGIYENTIKYKSADTVTYENTIKCKKPFFDSPEPDLNSYINE